MKWIRKVLKWLSDTFDIEDFFTLVALGLIFKGFYIYKPFIAYIVTGCLVLVIIAKGRKGK